MIKRFELSQATSKVAWVTRCPRVITSDTPTSAWADFCPPYPTLAYQTNHY